jgi:hypothetical protein
MDAIIRVDPFAALPRSVRKAYSFPVLPNTMRLRLGGAASFINTSSERRSLSARKAAKPQHNQTRDSASVKAGINFGRLPNPNQRRIESTKMMTAAIMMIAVSPVLI